jgi:hypothetical protein
MERAWLWPEMTKGFCGLAFIDFMQFAAHYKQGVVFPLGQLVERLSGMPSCTLYHLWWSSSVGL